MNKVSILKPQIGKVSFEQTPSRQSVISPKKNNIPKKKKVMINLKLYTSMHEIFLLGLN